MNIVTDTSVILATVLGEPEREWILDATARCRFIAPEVLPFEIGNALSVLLKRGILDAESVLDIWTTVAGIPMDLRLVDIPLALEIAAQYKLYAYDAYFLECALRLRLPLITLDMAMRRAAVNLRIKILEQ